MCRENHKAIGTGKVLGLSEVVKGVFHLVVDISEMNVCPQAGQFFMLKAEKSNVFLTRPISIYKIDRTEGKLKIHFLILQLGKGTKELCEMEVGKSITLTGPLGNGFSAPASNEKVAIIGGGIGVAPVAGFASTLKEKSYDFFACFKSGSYGIEDVKANKLFITTDDGSVGVKGMLPAVFNADLISKEKYTAVYACGPEPMLKYVQQICKEMGIKCFLSMEARMACGVGACLGCTINTTEGNKRCCKDGPVFDGDILIFGEPRKNNSPKINLENKDFEPDLTCSVAGVKFQNPVIAASGTFGFGKEYEELVNVNALGGICSKGLTFEKKSGNTGIRLIETPSGIINSIGLQNPGIPHFIEHELPEMLKYKATSIANLSGSSIETYVEGAKLLDKTDIPMIELNISCPNVKKGGMGFGLEPDLAFEVVKEVRAVTTKPLMVKLSPNAPYLLKIVEAVINAGADAISMVNTFQAIAIDVERGTTIFDNVRAGLSGSAVKPIALRMVFDVCQFIKTLPAEKQVPVVGLGGITTWKDAVEFIMAGAAAVQVGTATFINPKAMEEIVDGIKIFMKRKGYKSIEEMRGIALN